MSDPYIAEWHEVGIALYSENTSLSEEAQGVTTDGRRWYVCSNNTKEVVAFDNSGNRLASYRPSPDIAEQMWKDAGSPPVAFTPWGQPLPGGTLFSSWNPHFGAPGHYDGWLHVPVQGPRGVWRFRLDGGQQGWKKAPEPLPDDDLFPWCAIHPVTGILYTCNFGAPPAIRAYDRLTLEHLKDDDILLPPLFFDVPRDDNFRRPPLGGAAPNVDRFPLVTHVQGGTFTPCGRLILVTSEGNNVFCFSALNGHFFGGKGLGDFDSGYSEVESITLRNWQFDGVPAQVHIMELDNDVHSKDDFYLHSFSVGDPERL